MSRSTQFALEASNVVYPFQNCPKMFHTYFGKPLEPETGASLDCIRSVSETRFTAVERIQGIAQKRVTSVLQPNFCHIFQI